MLRGWVEGWGLSLFYVKHLSGAAVLGGGRKGEGMIYRRREDA